MNEQLPWIERGADVVAQAGLVVTGMHRSGTSATTRVLSLLGVALPRHLMTPQADNPNGFWESDIAVALNDELLAELGASWDDALTFLNPRAALAADEGVLLRMRRVLKADYENAGPIVMKDPRAAVLLDPWLVALERGRYAPRVVICIRNPLEVAASLAARNGFTTGRSLLLWLSYFLAAEKSSRDYPRAFVRYDELLDDWRAVMRRVQTTLDLPFPRWTPAIELEIDAFLSSSERHHAAPIAAVQTRADVANWVKQAFDWAIRAANDDQEPDTAILDSVAASYAEALAHFAPLIAEQRKALFSVREEAEAAAHAYAASGEQAVSALAARDAQITGLRQEASERGLLWADMKSALAESRERVRALEAENLEQREHTQALEAESRKQRETESTEYAARVADLESALAKQQRLAEQIRRSETMLAALVQAKEEELRVVALSAAEFESKSDQELQALAAQIEERDAALEQADAEAAGLRAELSALADSARVIVESTHRAYQSSTSWKLTAPLRWTGGAVKRGRFLAGNISTITDLSGGAGSVIGRVKTVYRREGLKGVIKRVEKVIDRVSEPPPAGVAGHIEMLERAQPLSARAAEWPARPSRIALLTADDLQQRIAATGLKLACLSFTHDNYAASFGGVQLCAQVEQRAAKQRGFTYLNLHPTRPLPIIAPQGGDQALAVSLDGTVLGAASAAVIVETIGALRSEGGVIAPVIHSMLGHAPETVSALVRASGAPARLWLHDYLTLCPNYNLLRNDISYCGAPAVGSNACAVCVHGQERLTQAERMARFFADTPVTVLSPSAFALSLWRDRTGFKGAAHVVPHVRMSNARPISASSGPVRIAYLGLPSHHKGWSTFQRLVSDFGGRPDYAFYHFGAMNGGLAHVKFVQTKVSADNVSAMTNAIADNAIDLALIWSRWPETFCFTMYEALAGGAHILTNPDSGNVQVMTHELDAGLVLPSEQALFENFANGKVAEYVQGAQGRGRSASTLEFSAMSFAIDDEASL